MAELSVHLKSDATRIEGEGPAILAHVLSDALTWGLGFTQALEQRWPIPLQRTRQHLLILSPRPGMGEVAWTEVSGTLLLAHLIAESSGRSYGSGLLMDALGCCLDRVADRALALGATVHAPPMGTGLSGGSWVEVRALLESRLVERGIPVVIHCMGSRLPE